MIEGLLGRKLGMLQVFDKSGHLRGATVIEAGPCFVTQLRTVDRDGYQAVQLGFGTAKRRNKPMRGHLKRLGDLRFVRELGTINDTPSQNVGDRVGTEIFHEGDRVDVTGISKGRGFAGGVKRYGFRGGPKTHGQSDRHRAPGAIGAGNTPGRTFKGMRMAGHMGDARVTVKNLEVIESDPARGLLLVAGAVPGARNGLLKIRYSKVTRKVAVSRTPTERQQTPQAPEATTNTSDDEAAPQQIGEAEVASQPEASEGAPPSAEESSE